MALTSEVLLLVSENLDLGSLSALAQTCKRVRGLIATYEVSIVKARLRGQDRQPFGPHGGSVLSSGTFAREVMRPYSFAVLQELGLRERRVDALLSRHSELMRAVERSTAFQALPPAELHRLVRGLRRACAAADRLADCVADVMVRPDWRPPHPLHHGHELDDGPQTHDTSVRCRDGNRRHHQHHHHHHHHYHQQSFVVATARAVLARHARLAQMAFLNTLSPLDLAFLYNLVAIAGMAYAETHPAEMADPVSWEHVVAFQETFLRNGSAALWACCHARETATPWRGAKDAVIAEIHAWEMGGELDAGMLPGLHMSLVDAFTRQSGRAKERAAKEMERLVLNEIAA